MYSGSEAKAYIGAKLGRWGCYTLVTALGPAAAGRLGAAAPGGLHASAKANSSDHWSAARCCSPHAVLSAAAARLRPQPENSGAGSDGYSM